MFFFLSKLLPIFVYPLGLTCLFLCVVLFLNRSERGRIWSQRLLLGVVLGLWLSSSGWVSGRLVWSLEKQYVGTGDLPTAEVIILLGGGTRANLPPRAMAEINERGDRMLYAAHLYHAGKGSIILATGGSPLNSNNQTSEAENMAQILELLGVPAEAIWLEERAVNTYENGVYSAQMLEDAGIQQALLVTSALHMPRSVRVFEKQGIEVIPAPTDFFVTMEPSSEETNNQSPWIFKVLPTVENLQITTSVLKEYIGMVIYRWRGWL